MSEQWLWADGGESMCAPECTIPALWAALGAGADGLVLPVRAASDSRLVCVPHDTLAVNGSGGTAVSLLTSQQVREYDAGVTFRSSVLDERNRVVDRHGQDTPWKGHNVHDALYHPELDEVLLHFGRRTRFLLLLRGPNGTADRRKLVDAVMALLTRYAVLGRVTLAGDAATLDAIGTQHTRRCLDLGADTPLADAISQASRAKVPLVLARVGDARELDRAGAAGVGVIARTQPGQPVFDREQHDGLAGQSSVAGYLVEAVGAMHALMHPRGLVLQEPFSGRLDTSRWMLGYSRRNHDAQIEVNDGLRIAVEGEEYSGAAAFSTFSVFGDFDARMSFEVTNPNQGTTFELAAVHVDSGYRRNNLTFDVHGAPPYASSERDEDDGFRIGWNNGPALTRWVDGEPQSSNLYNCYGRDVGYAKRDSPTGRLRLTRRGDVYNAYYTDKFNEGWVLSGSVVVPALAGSVFLRLGAKHWPKGGNEPPTNSFRFTDFELYQWD